MRPHAAKGSLTALAGEYWEGHLRTRPLFATSIGAREHDDRLSDITPEGRARDIARLEDLLRRLRDISEADLDARERVTRRELEVVIRRNLDIARCDLEAWTVDPLGGAVVAFLNVESYQPVRTVDEARAMVARWMGMAPWIDDHVTNLRSGLAAGKVAVRSGIEKVLEQIADLEGKPVDAWVLLRPLCPDRPDWTEADRSEFRDALTATVRDRVRPAFLRLRDALRDEILPHARSDERPGIVHVPDGPAAYERLIRAYTGLDLTPHELHSTGRQEVARINGEMEALGERVFGIRDRLAVLQKLRSDPELYFRTRDEVETTARDALARASAAIPRWFGLLPEADCEVVRMEAHEEKHSTIAYYRQPTADGSRPGRYYINTSAPETRPRYEAEVLAYHESIPGHHLQIAIAQELEDLPDFRRHLGVTAFVEGWGLYTERLADEMGLYSSDLDRIGVLSYDAWRACRLVVDTGMHAMGWTRRQAIDFLLENTALAENNIVNEVDRYIAWPAQALTYKLGQFEIQRLRRELEARDGADFDLRAFHDELLAHGSLPLSTLARELPNWVTARA